MKEQTALGAGYPSSPYALQPMLLTCGLKVEHPLPLAPCPSLKPCNHPPPTHPLARSYSILRLGCRNSPFTELESSSLSRSLQKIRLWVNWAAQFLTPSKHATAPKANLSVDERTDYCACEAWHHSRALGLLWSDLPYHGAPFVANRQVWQLAEDGGKNAEKEAIFKAQINWISVFRVSMRLYWIWGRTETS